jgi:hypothetical protein
MQIDPVNDRRRRGRKQRRLFSATAVDLFVGWYL